MFTKRQGAGGYTWRVIEKTELMQGDGTKRIDIEIEPDSLFKEGLIKILEEYVDIFSWSPKEMFGLDESIATRKLNVHQRCCSKNAKIKEFALDRNNNC